MRVQRVKRWFCMFRYSRFENNREMSGRSAVAGAASASLIDLGDVATPPSLPPAAQLAALCKSQTPIKKQMTLEYKLTKLCERTGPSSEMGIAKIL